MTKVTTVLGLSLLAAGPAVAQQLTGIDVFLTERWSQSGSDLTATGWDVSGRAFQSETGSEEGGFNAGTMSFPAGSTALEPLVLEPLDPGAQFPTLFGRASYGSRDDLLAAAVSGEYFFEATNGVTTGGAVLTLVGTEELFFADAPAQFSENTVTVLAGGFIPYEFSFVWSEWSGTPLGDASNVYFRLRQNDQTVFEISGADFFPATPTIFNNVSTDWSSILTAGVVATAEVIFSARDDMSYSEFGSIYAGYDLVTLLEFTPVEFGSAPIPEPSTYALLAGLAAIGGVLGRRRRRG